MPLIPLATLGALEDLLSVDNNDQWRKKTSLGPCSSSEWQDTPSSYA
jgi:hypothetical protein